MKEPVWLPRKLIVTLQSLAIAEFGGSPGIRDEGLLESALARPQNLLAYGEPSLFALAAAYAFGLAKNHAFVDGNKRIAFAAIDVFLQLNGCELTASDVEATVVLQDLAAGKLSEDDLARWIEINSRPLA
ncbi:MAG: type II toxin-antitoxin system death-on-curing family toxin [Alphaproteobacteria bacterium]|nr:type II toxin-antitoxin system death-on-curing family toxin [Alphaproteobacteria bacterium]